MEYVACKTIVGKTNNKSWFGTDYTMNIYRGCHHGCIYCDSRSDCYGEKNFDQVKVKENALAVIKNDLSRFKKSGVVATGSMSDPYNKFEEKLNLTGRALSLINSNGFGVSITTKSPLITRDIEILKSIQQHSPVICKITITTADDCLCSKIERRVAKSSERFDAIKKLSDAGIFCGILLMPVLPYINDTCENITAIVQKAAESGAKFVYPAMGVTLRGNQRDYFYFVLDKIFPHIKEKYIAKFGTQYSCGSPNAQNLYAAFKKECAKHNMLYKMNDIINAYRQPYSMDFFANGDDVQLDFFTPASSEQIDFF